jgi:hypothetical protein
MEHIEWQHLEFRDKSKKGDYMCKEAATPINR